MLVEPMSGVDRLVTVKPSNALKARFAAVDVLNVDFDFVVTSDFFYWAQV